MTHLTIYTHAQSGYSYADEPLHLSRTLYKSAAFMQNKPNFPHTRTDLTLINISCYENPRLPTPRKDKPNPSPIKPNLLHTRINLTPVNTSRYENPNPVHTAKNKPNQIQSHTPQPNRNPPRRRPIPQNRPQVVVDGTIGDARF